MKVRGLAFGDSGFKVSWHRVSWSLRFRARALEFPGSGFSFVQSFWVQGFWLRD